MLGKLIKYEVKATARTMLPLYGVLLALAVVNRLFVFGDIYNRYGRYDHSGQGGGLISSLFALALMLVMFAVFVVTLVVMIQRFYRNLLTDEGYLSFTLPVRPWQHITAKMLVTTLWSILSLLVTFLALMIIAMNTELLHSFPYALSIAFDYYFRAFGANGYFFFLESLLLYVLSIMNSVLFVYASIALGHMLNRHRMLASFGAFILLLVATSFTSSIVQQILSAMGFNHWLFYQSNILRTHMVMLGSSAKTVLYGGILFAITNWILSRRLNLD